MTTSSQPPAPRRGKKPYFMTGVRELGFSRKERLRRRREFLETYAKGDKVQGTYLVLFFSENGLQHHRLGVTVSRRIGSSAVRNRVKRRLREIFRSSKAMTLPYCDLVVNAKRRATQVSYKELEGDFWGAIERRSRNLQK